MKTKQLYQKITNTIIKLLEQKLEGSNQSWINIKDGRLPHNISTQKNYRGINNLILSIAATDNNFLSNGWITFNQAKKLGATIKKGSKASAIYFFKIIYKDNKEKIIPHKVVDTLTPAEKNKLNYSSIIRSFPVFNTSQVNKLPDELVSNPIITLNEFESNEQAEKIITNTKAEINIIESNQAFYNAKKDTITLPLREQFKTPINFYNVAFHELTHWTAHESRLNRPINNKAGTAKYAKEELIAELGAAFLLAEIGNEKLITDNAAYIKSWLTLLNNDSKAVVSAASKAQMATDYILK